MVSEVQTNKLAVKDKLNLAYMLVEEDPVNILKLARNTYGNRFDIHNVSYLPVFAHVNISSPVFFTL